MLAEGSGLRVRGHDSEIECNGEEVVAIVLNVTATKFLKTSVCFVPTRGWGRETLLVQALGVMPMDRAGDTFSGMLNERPHALTHIQKKQKHRNKKMFHDGGAENKIAYCM